MFSITFSVSECVLCLECKVYHLQSDSFLRQSTTSYSFCNLHNNWHTNLNSILKSRDITLPTKVRLVKAMVFPVAMYGCESWTIKKAELKNWCSWTVALEKTPESPVDCKEIQPVYPKGNQSWIVNGRTDAEAETPILCPPDAKNWLTGKDPYAGKDWRQEEKGTTEDERVGWPHWLDRHEFEYAPGVDDG